MTVTRKLKEMIDFIDNELEDIGLIEEEDLCFLNTDPDVFYYNSLKEQKKTLTSAYNSVHEFFAETGYASLVIDGTVNYGLSVENSKFCVNNGLSFSAFADRQKKNA